MADDERDSRLRTAGYVTKHVEKQAKQHEHQGKHREDKNLPKGKVIRRSI